MVQNYTHGPSMSNHLVLPTTIFQKVGPFEHAKSHNLQSHLMWWVLFTTCKHNPFAQTYEPEVDNLFLELWHIEKYFNVEQLSNSPQLTHSQILERFNVSPKLKTTERQGVEARSLARSTLEGQRGMLDLWGGTRKKLTSFNYSNGCAQKCMVGTLLVLGQATGNSDTQDSPQPALGGSHHLPSLWYILQLSMGATSKWFFVLGPQVGVPKFPQLGLLQL